MFILVYALQLNIYLSEIQDPLILPNKSGMLPDIFFDVIKQMETNQQEPIQILYVNSQNQANISFNFIRNFDQEKGMVLIQDYPQIDYQQYDLSKPILTENYIFVYPSLVVTLFSRIIWELFFNYIIIIFPWIMLYSNLMIFFISKEKYKTYSKKIRISLQILVGNSETNRSTLILKVIFIILTFMISAIIFIDFIYVVGNAIQRQNFNSLNDLAMNQFELCFIKQDQFITDMVQRYRDISYQQKDDIQQCIDQIFKTEDAVIFVSEFQYGLFLKEYPEYTYLKYQLKYNTFRSYQLLMNQSIDLNIRQQINMSIDSMWPQKYDLGVRNKYMIQLVYVKSAVVSLIFTNKTVLTTSIMISITSILFFQISIIKKQCTFCRNKIPFLFNKNKNNINLQSKRKETIDESLSKFFMNGILEELN